MEEAAVPATVVPAGGPGSVGSRGGLRGGSTRGRPWRASDPGQDAEEEGGDDPSGRLPGGPFILWGSHPFSGVVGAGPGKPVFSRQ